MTATTLNTIGLGLDLLGVALLFFFPVPGGLISIKQEEKADRNLKISRFALPIIATGFFCQGWSNYLD